jgi:hypothetical protein
MLDGLCLIAGPSEDELDYEGAVDFGHRKANRRVSLFSSANRRSGVTPLFDIATNGSVADTETIESESDEECESWQI